MKNHNRRYSYYRYPRTTQEKRWNEAHKKYVRGRRSPRQLPSSYDDLNYSNRGKSWKNSRCYQRHEKKRYEFVKEYYLPGRWYCYGHPDYTRYRNFDKRLSELNINHYDAQIDCGDYWKIKVYYWYHCEL